MEAWGDLIPHNFLCQLNYHCISINPLPGHFILNFAFHWSHRKLILFRWWRNGMWFKEHGTQIPAEAGTGKSVHLSYYTADFKQNAHSLYLRSPMTEGMGFAVVLQNWDQQETRLTQVGNKQWDKKCQIFDQCKKKKKKKPYEVSCFYTAHQTAQAQVLKRLINPFLMDLQLKTCVIHVT